MKVLVADKEVSRAARLRDRLMVAGSVVELGHDLTGINWSTYDLAIIDAYAFPHWTVACERTATTRPGLLLLVSGDAAARTEALDLGADDCVVRSTGAAELAARARAILRRRLGIASPALQLGALSVDLNTRVAAHKGMKVELPERGFRILELLASGRVVPKLAIRRSLSRTDGAIGENAAEIALSRLRRLVKPFGCEIRPVRGVGYRLVTAKGDVPCGRPD